MRLRRWRVFLGGKRYQMKANAILIGANLAASVPLLLSQQAMAADSSDTASFLRSAISNSSHSASASQTATSSATPSFKSTSLSNVRKLPRASDLGVQSFSSPRALQTRTALMDSDKSLRPFMPGRKLPRKADLEAARIANQMPQMDESHSSLAGSVDMSYQRPSADANYSSPGYGTYSGSNANRDIIVRETSRRLKNAAQAMAHIQRPAQPRVTPGQMMITPGQVGQPCAKQAFNPAQADATAPSESEWADMARSVGQNTATSMTPAANSQEDELESMARQLKTQVGESNAPVSTAGPAPFPLSLIPEASLKQLMGKKSPGMSAMGSQGGQMGGGQMTGARPAAAPSYFGSWHGQGQSPAAAHSNLRPSGFHTYLTAANQNSRALTSSAFKQYSPIATRNARRSAPSKVAILGKVKPAAKPHNATMAAYGEYHAPSL